MVSGIEMNTGAKISGAAHLGLILWLLVGGFFSFDHARPMEVAEVSVVTSDELAAMMGGGGKLPEISDAMAAPAAPEAAPSPAVPPPERAPAQSPRPRAAEAAAPEPAATVEPPAQVPAAEVVTRAPVAPPAPDVPDGTVAVLAPERAPAPRQAPRVAPRPAEAPDPLARTDIVERQATRPDAAPSQPVPTKPQEATAPEEATTDIVTEATKEAGGTVLGLAPAGSPRPASKPAPPKRTAPEPVQTAAPAPERSGTPATPARPAAQAPAETADDADAIAAAVAAAVASEAGGSAAGSAAEAPSGPPMTSGEKDALRLAVQNCWVVDVGSESAAVTVTVQMEMQENGKVVSDSIRMVEASSGSDGAVRAAFDAARRAILRCQKDGYPLPPEKFGQWQRVEIVFNPERMRIR